MTIDDQRSPAPPTGTAAAAAVAGSAGRDEVAAARARFRRAAIAFGAGTAVFLFLMIVKAGGTRFTSGLDDVVELVAAAIAAGACILVAERRTPHLRRAWRWIGASALCWAVGEAIWTWYDLVVDPVVGQVPFPSAADVFFLLALPLAVIGVLLFPNAPREQVSRARSILDGVIVAGSLLFVSWTTTLGTVYRNGTGSVLAQSVGLAYPIGDVVIATVALIVIARGSGARRTALGLIVAGLLCLTISDSSFAYLTEVGTFGFGNAVDTGWVAGYLLIALAALWPEDLAPDESPLRRGPSRWQVALPYAFLGLAVVAAVVKRSTAGPFDQFLLIDGLVLISAVFARQVLMIAENQRLNRDLEGAIATLESHEQELVHSAFHDPLTGLANRVLFADRVTHALAGSERSAAPVAVLLCDLDSFKDVNDTLGHSTGDEVLVAVATRLASCVRPSDTVARIGGDEFSILLDEAHDPAEIAAVAQRVCAAMRLPFSVDDRDFVVHASVGIAVGHGATTAPETMLRDADIALYAVKRAGGDDYTFFDDRIGDAHIDRLGLQAELAAAVPHGQLLLEYQPIVDLRTARPVGMEALLRWRHPRLGVLAPSHFLDLAESSGVIISAGMWTLERALRDLAGLRAAASDEGSPAGPAGEADLFMSVNVSARQLAAGNLPEAIERSLAASAAPPSSLRLELTEGTLIEQVDGAIHLLGALKALGVGLDIDDFGTGYSSLAYLQRLPIDRVKIDRMFIEGLGQDRRNDVIVESIVTLAHALGLESVAEGVETAHQADLLRSLGCDFAQGYFIARPMGADEAAEWLRSRARSATR